MATQKAKETLVIINAATGVETVRDLTEEELLQRETDAAQYAVIQADREAMATARASALAKLAELGLTADEIAAL
jgi:hypothetical protein